MKLLWTALNHCRPHQSGPARALRAGPGEAETFQPGPARRESLDPSRPGRGPVWLLLRGSLKKMFYVPPLNHETTRAKHFTVCPRHFVFVTSKFIVSASSFAFTFWLITTVRTVLGATIVANHSGGGSPTSAITYWTTSVRLCKNPGRTRAFRAGPAGPWTFRAGLGRDAQNRVRGHSEVAMNQCGLH